MLKGGIYLKMRLSLFVEVSSIHLSYFYSLSQFNLLTNSSHFLPYPCLLFKLVLCYFTLKSCWSLALRSRTKAFCPVFCSKSNRVSETFKYSLNNRVNRGRENHEGNYVHPHLYSGKLFIVTQHWKQCGESPLHENAKSPPLLAFFFQKLNPQ